MPSSVDPAIETGKKQVRCTERCHGLSGSAGCCWGSHLRALILEQIHLLFTIQPASVNIHVDTVKEDGCEALLSVDEHGVT